MSQTKNEIWDGNSEELNLIVKRKSKQIVKIKPHYFTKDHLIKMNTKVSSKKSTISLLLILFSFVSLNFPYTIIWTISFYNIEFLNVHPSSLSHFPIGLQICQTFSLLHYMVKLIILVINGSLLRRFLKHTRIFFLFFN